MNIDNADKLARISYWAVGSVGWGCIIAVIGWLVWKRDSPINWDD